MSKTHDDYDVDAGWSSDDLVDWLNDRLAQVRVRSVELFNRGAKFFVRVHYK